MPLLKTRASGALYLRFAVVMGLALLPWQSAYPIGKIGNNSRIGDVVEGFTAAIPASFPNVLSNANDRSAQLVSSEILPSDSSDPMGVEMPTALTMISTPLAGYFPPSVSLDPQTLSTYLRTQFQFALTPVTGPACAKLFFGENEVGYVGLAVWGKGHGYVVTVQKTPSQIGRTAVMSLLQTTMIKNACGQ